MRWVLCGAVFLVVVAGSTGISHQHMTPMTDGIETTLTALDNLLGWARSHYYLLIVDFLFSIKVVQGELELMSMRRGMPRDLQIRISLLRDKADKLAELVNLSFRHSNDSYYEKFYPLVSNKYYIRNFYIRPRRVKPSRTQPRPKEYEETYSETQSDNCMLEILGTEKRRPCLISSECYLQMTSDDSEDYQLTHQILFSILAQVKGCGRTVEILDTEHGRNSTRVVDAQIGKVYRRLKPTLLNGQYDLFTEMLMVGMLLNYRDFYSPSLLDLVFLWQDHSGCYTEEAHQPVSVKRTTERLGRRLLTDELVDDSCSEHTTALSLVVLCLLLRSQLETLSLQFPPTTLSPQQLPALSWGFPGLCTILLCVLVVLWLARMRRLRSVARFFT